MKYADVLGGRKFDTKMTAYIKEDSHFVTIILKGFCSVIENELFYPVQEFKEKGLRKVLSENGYTLIVKPK